MPSAGPVRYQCCEGPDWLSGRCRLIGFGRSYDEEDEGGLYHMVVMAGVEQAH